MRQSLRQSSSSPKVGRDLPSGPSLGQRVCNRLQQDLGNQRLVDGFAGVDRLGMVAVDSLVLATAGVDDCGWLEGENSEAVMRMATAPAVGRARVPGAGQPLPPAIQARMEQVFGHSFGHVRIHQGAEAGQAAAAMGARAFTVGSHVVFGGGQWAPGTSAGDRLLAHELAHVWQGDRGRLPEEGVSEPQDPAEQEARIWEKMVAEPVAPLESSATGMWLRDEEVRSGEREWAPAGDDPMVEEIDRLLATPTEGSFVARDCVGASSGPGCTPVGGPTAASPATTTSAAPSTTTTASTTPLSAEALLALRLKDLYRYAAANPDWGKGLKPKEQAPIVGLLDQAASPNRKVLENLPGEIVVNLNPLLRFLYEALEAPAPMVAPDVATATLWATELKDLSDNLGSTVLFAFADWTWFEELDSHSWVRDCSDYFGRSQAVIAGKADLSSYLASRREVDPRDYMTALPDIRSLHWFGKATLDQLTVNLGDTTNVRPVTMLLFSAIDHNGALQRNPSLTSVVCDTSHLTLILQGKTSVMEFVPLLEEYAALYTPAGTFEEVAFDGHGTPASIEIAASRAEDGSIKSVQTLAAYDPADQAGRDADPFRQALGTYTDPDARITLVSCSTGMNQFSDPSSDAAVRQTMADHNNVRGDMERSLPGREVTAPRGLYTGGYARDSEGHFRLNPTFDPAVAGDRGTYVLTGMDPEGVMAALVEFEVTHGHEAAMVLVRTRIASTGSGEPWSDILLKYLFAHLLSDAPTNRALWLEFGRFGQAVFLEEHNTGRFTVTGVMVPSVLTTVLNPLWISASAAPNLALLASQMEAWCAAVPDNSLQQELNFRPAAETVPRLNVLGLITEAATLLAGKADKGHFVLALLLFQEDPKNTDVLNALNRHRNPVDGFASSPHRKVFSVLPLEQEVLKAISSLP